MRVLLIGSYGPSLLNFRGPLIGALVAGGHEVHVAAPGLDVELRRRLESLGAIVHDTPLERQSAGFVSDLKYLQRLTALFRALRPGLAITYTIKPNIWGAFAGARTATPTAALVTGLGIAFTDTGKEDSFKLRIIKKLVRLLYRMASDRNWRIFFQNPDDRSDFEAAGCLSDSSKVRMMRGSGVDLRHFSPSPMPETPSFLMISRILGAKGVREYARAAIRVKKIHPEAKFRLVGFFDKGPDAISESEVAQWVSEGIEYLGPTDDVRPHFASTRVYVLPSYREGTPRSVLEAMASGRAILTSDAPGCRETVIDGVNGYLVAVRNTDMLASRMCELIENPNLTEQMGAASLAMANEKFDVRKVNARLLSDLDLL